MNRSPRFWLPILVASAVLALGLAPSAKADTFSISLISSGSGLYDYAITVQPGSTAIFNKFETISFTGLSGVTGASVGGVLGVASAFTVQSFTSSSVTFVQSEVGVVSIGITVGDLVIDSTAPLGTVGWSGTSNGQLNSGTVSGPVSSATPEPSSLLLLAGGLTGLFGLRRKRIG